MERLISDEERIRRAEDILERRRNLEYVSSNSKLEKNVNNGIGKKMLIQALICMCIYCGIYYIKANKNEYFCGVINTVKDILNYDVNFKQIYYNLYAEIKKIKINNLNPKSNEADSQSNITNIENDEKNTGGDVNEGVNSRDQNNENIQVDSIENQNSAENVDSNNSVSTIENEAMGIGGAFDENSSSEPISYELQMQLDADYIKKKLNMINPLETGVITSRFGSRAATSVVSGNHKGIDLGASTGSIIVAAADGKVVEASSDGDFGIHLKIQNDDVVVIYGHCSELLVNNGDTVSKGQQIAKVGSTRKGYWTTFTF